MQLKFIIGLDLWIRIKRKLLMEFDSRPWNTLKFEPIYIFLIRIAKGNKMLVLREGKEWKQINNNISPTKIRKILRKDRYIP